MMEMEKSREDWRGGRGEGAVFFFCFYLVCLEWCLELVEPNEPFDQEGGGGGIWSAVDIR